MKILQQPVKAKRNAIVQVHFDKPVVVKLISHNMFPKYKNGAKHVAQGGFYEQSPARFTVPYDGVWHAVIERGSHYNPIDVKGRVELLPPEIKERAYFDPNEGEEPALIEEAAPVAELNEEASEEESDEEKVD
jgi:hypothetical protein